MAKTKVAKYEETKNSGFFGQFPMAMLDDVNEKKINTTDVIVYSILHSYAIKSGRVWASNKTLSAHLDCSERTIQSSLDKLEQVGWLRRTFESNTETNEEQRYIRLAYHHDQLFTNEKRVIERKKTK